MFMFTFIPVLMGAALATQTGINAKLRYYVRSPYLASGLSFLIALFFLIILCLIQRQELQISLSFIQTHPYWIWLGGILGMIVLTGNILLFSKLGSLLSSVLPIMGQIVMGMLIDTFGLFYSPVKNLNFVRLLGLFLLILGVLVVVGITKKLNQSSQEGEKGSQHYFYYFLGIVLGAFTAIQTAINGHLSILVHSPIRASLYSFFIGTCLLLAVILFLKTPITPVLSAVKATKTYPWLWLGGILGGSYILIGSWLSPIIGTGQVVVFALFGQLLFSSLIQHFGWLDSPKVAIDRSKIAGLIIMFIGVVLIRIV